MTQSRPPFDNPLDDLFAEARATPPDVPDALLKRVVADALAEMPKPQHVPLWSQVLRTLGGWPAVAGLAATACLGLWIGGTASDSLLVGFGWSDTASVDFDEGFGADDLWRVEG